MQWWSSNPCYSIHMIVWSTSLRCLHIMDHNLGMPVVHGPCLDSKFQMNNTTCYTHIIHAPHNPSKHQSWAQSTCGANLQVCSMYNMVSWCILRALVHQIYTTNWMHFKSRMVVDMHVKQSKLWYMPASFFQSWLPPLCYHPIRCTLPGTTLYPSLACSQGCIQGWA